MLISACFLLWQLVQRLVAGDAWASTLVEQTARMICDVLLECSIVLRHSAEVNAAIKIKIKADMAMYVEGKTITLAGAGSDGKPRPKMQNVLVANLAGGPSTNKQEQAIAYKDFLAVSMQAVKRT